MNSFEKQSQEKEKQNVENLLRDRVRVFLKVDISADPFEDREFQGFLRRHFITEGDAMKIVDEERVKLSAQEAEMKQRLSYRKEK